MFHIFVSYLCLWTNQTVSSKIQPDIWMLKIVEIFQHFWNISEIASPFPCCPVNCKCFWKKTQIEKNTVFRIDSHKTSQIIKFQDKRQPQIQIITSLLHLTLSLKRAKVMKWADALHLESNGCHLKHPLTTYWAPGWYQVPNLILRFLMTWGSKMSIANINLNQSDVMLA